MEDVGPLNNRGWGTNAEDHCGMVHFTDGEEDLLYVVGGWGHAAPSSPQHGAQYHQMVLVVCVPMNNTFSLCPQVSDTVLSQYSPPSSE